MSEKKVERTNKQEITGYLEKVLFNLFEEKIVKLVEKKIEDFEYSIDSKIVDFEIKFDNLSDKIAENILKKIEEKSKGK